MECFNIAQFLISVLNVRKKHFLTPILQVLHLPNQQTAGIGYHTAISSGYLIGVKVCSHPIRSFLLCRLLLLADMLADFAMYFPFAIQNYLFNG
jgi:hypothetical protein